MTAKYGYPNEITADQGMEHWSYGLRRMDVFFQGGIVMAVRLYKGSDIKFDKSGLGADAAMAAYAEAYKLAAVPVIPADDGILSPAYDLPQGEKFHVPVAGLRLASGRKIPRQPALRPAVRGLTKIYS